LSPQLTIMGDMTTSNTAAVSLPLPAGTVHERGTLPGGRIHGEAVFSDDFACRYWLLRDWTPRGEVPQQATWVMLNPSQAGAARNDMTVTSCIGFTRRAGYTRLAVVNLGALISTDPAGLAGSADPVGPHNDVFVRAAVAESAIVVMAWGNVPAAFVDAADAMAGLIWSMGKRTYVLGLTDAGFPRHPCRLASRTQLVEYPPF